LGDNRFKPSQTSFRRLGSGVDHGRDAEGVVAGVFAHAEVQAHNDRNVFQASPGELPVSDIHSL